MTLTLIHGTRCEPCANIWHWLCHARRGALCPDACACDCRDADGLTTEAALAESARRAPEHLARHLRVQQAAELAAAGLDAAHPESVEALEALSPVASVHLIAERSRNA